MHRQTSRLAGSGPQSGDRAAVVAVRRSVPGSGAGRPGPIDPLLKLAIVCGPAGLIAVPLHYGLSPFLVEFDELVGLLRCARCSHQRGAAARHAALTLVFSLLYRLTPAPRREPAARAP